MSQSDELLNSTQVGQIVGKSGRTVVRMVDKGLIEPVGKLPGDNGAYLFRRSDAEALRDELQKKTA